MLLLYVEIKDEPIKNLYPKNFLSIKKQGRQILLKELDAKIQKISDGSYKLWDCIQYQYRYRNCKWVFETR